MPEQNALISAIEMDFKRRLPNYHKTRGEGIALLAGLLLETRSANLMELAAALPRQISSADNRYQYVERQLKNPATDVDEVVRSYAVDTMERMSAQNQTVILQMDQSRINDGNEVLMVSLRLRNRAVPVAWRVRSTQGNIGFPVQKELLDVILAWIPPGVSVLLAADRFYGTAALVGWCKKAGWSYRIRLKGNLTLDHEGGELTTGDVVGLAPGIVGAELTDSGVSTNIGVLHEKGHKEPWIIAMDARPGKYTVLDYGMRWGIEAMFSDFKSRGFGLNQSQIRKPERLERLILVMSIALYWAVSCGMFAEAQANGQKGGL